MEKSFGKNVSCDGAVDGLAGGSVCPENSMSYSGGPNLTTPK